MSKRLCLISVILPFLLAVSSAQADKLNLVLQVTVDQLRGDFPSRFKDRFGPAGFRRLMNDGVVYINAHYGHATTTTAPGHATLYTGGYARQHGVAGNDWYDQTTGQRVYCVEDNQHTIIGKASKPHSGTSPRNLTSTTIGDELVLATGGKSRVFAVSIKDRGAIIPGGHLGKAFWYSKDTGEFVTSTYYYERYPVWVQTANERKFADRYRGKQWELLHDRSTYIYAHMDDRPFEKSYKQLGRTFPHPLDNEQPEDYYSSLRFTPMSDELTLDFVKTLVNTEKIGQGDSLDYLSISFSATDYIGHAFGPNSLEVEDNLLRLDHTLGELFAFIDDTVGLDGTLIVLASDHGVDDIPEYKRTLHFDAGRLYPAPLMKKTNAALQRRYKADQDFVVAFWDLSVYLNLQTVKNLGLDLAEVEQTLADEILKVPGIAIAATRSNLLSGRVPNTPIMQKVQRAFHPRRSGNVLIVQNQFWFLNGNLYAATHGSPYAYDTYVPVMFAGPGISPAVVAREIGPEDIASTIAAYLGIRPPSGSVGTVLPEVVEQRARAR
jgi:predicted AlkP superfamily pyrophosphatase or phosphodiesterase